MDTGIEHLPDQKTSDAAADHRMITDFSSQKPNLAEVEESEPVNFNIQPGVW